ncbi:MAG TPA: hypothetical protein VLA61_15130 [Ideonella sp.]|uniref:hypothetical protein n=1 Tax=Ideonella sp. TaxID=1929293 RepID=UPI002C1B4A56|nr:hypothetical protein [Ideonella sp.]HSI49604.1 hypothetical protein [Ideonella sp.]
MISVSVSAGNLPGVCGCGLAAVIALCSAAPALAQDGPAGDAEPVAAVTQLPASVPASAKASGEVSTATPITGQSTPLPAYDGYSSSAAAEMAARYRAPSLGGGRSLNTSQRSAASLWRDTDAPTRSIWRVGLAPSLPAPQMVGGPPPASPHVELAFTARVERFDRGFKPRSDADAWKELGTFRMQLGGTNEMALKPRRGGLSLSWQSKF